MRWEPMSDHPYDGWEPEVHPLVERVDGLPLKLTVNRPAQTSGRDRLGTQEWSRHFYRYLTPAFQHTADKVQGRVNWWHIDYVIARLQHDTTIKANQLQALFAIRLHGMDWQVAFDHFHCTQAQLARLEQRIDRQFRLQH